MENIEQKVEAEGQSHVNAIANLNAENVYFGNKPDRHVSLDDCPASFKHMQGRKEAIAALNITLADPKKAIACIVGLGGYGKSTLAAKLFDEWEGGRFWADLSQRSRDFREFATRAIAQLGQKSLEQVNNLPEAQLGYELAAVLQGRGFLVVLDNLESLLDGDGNLEIVLWREFLQNWANGGEGSKVLVTTREEPNLPKMRFFRYELSKGLEDAEGASVLRDFKLLGTEVELVAVSQRVGGIPLSLMLIVGLLCNDYEEEPHVRFLPEDLFGIEGAHRLGRVTTEAVFRASFERLEPRLQNLLMAVSVFAKPFDGTMAAAVIADEEVTDRDLLLLKKRGFVLVQSGCYRFQPQIQELVQRQAESLTKFHRKAISYYWKNLKPTLDPCYDTLEDADPYLQIFHHYCELGEYESAFHSIRSDLNRIDNFLELSGNYAKLIELYLLLFNVWKSNQTKTWRFRASLTSLGNAYFCIGQYQNAVIYYQQQLDLAMESGDKQCELNSLGNLGNVYLSQGLYQKSIEFHQRSLDISKKMGNKQSESIALVNLGSVYFSQGMYQKSIEFHQQSLNIAREVGDQQSEINGLGSLGLAFSSLGQYQEAIIFYTQCLAIAKKVGNRRGEANSLGNLGSTYYLLGQYKTSLSFYQQHLDISRDISDKQGEANSLGGLGLVFSSLGQYQEALSCLQQSLDIEQIIGDKHGEASSLGNLGIFYYTLNQYPETIIFHQQQLEIARKIGNNKNEANALSGLGNAYSSLGQLKKSITFHNQSLEIARKIGDRHGEAIALMNLANSYHQKLRVVKGFIYFYKANKILQELQIPAKKTKSHIDLMISIIRFAQRGKWQIVLCFCIGLFAFPLFLACLVTLLLWRLIKGKVKR